METWLFELGYYAGSDRTFNLTHASTSVVGTLKIINYILKWNEIFIDIYF